MKINFADMITQDHLLALTKKELNIKLKSYNVDDNRNDIDDMDTDHDLSDSEPSKYDGTITFIIKKTFCIICSIYLYCCLVVLVVASAPHTAELQTKKEANKWIEISSDSEEDKNE